MIKDKVFEFSKLEKSKGKGEYLLYIAEVIAFIKRPILDFY
jgi:hypothetical protein